MPITPFDRHRGGGHPPIADPTEYRDYLDWSWVEQHRKLNFMWKYMPKEFANLNPATVADSEKNYQAVNARFEVPNKKSLRQSCCKLNLRERAIKADFEEMYSAVYGSVSELSHGSFGGLAQHVESVIGDNWQPAIPPSITGCSLALQIVYYCAFRAVQTIVQLTEFSELYKIYLIHATLGEMP